MSLWGRNDQAVTANSTTTRESSNGAPLFTAAYVKGGKTGLAANSSHASNSAFGNTSAGSVAAIDAGLYQNVTPSAFVSGQATGVFGVSRTELANNRANSSREKPAHCGWTLRKAGTGPIVSISYTGVATAYSNGDRVIVTSPVAGGNAFFTIATNTSGGNLTFTLTQQGFGFLNVNASPNAVYANSSNGATVGGSGATFNPVAGGRAGRIHHEVLVAQHSLGAQTAAYGTPATTSDTAGDNTLFPGT